MADKPVKSPCNSVCMLNDEDVCVGCYRTSEEIRIWSVLNNDQRRDVVIACGERNLKSKKVQKKPENVRRPDRLFVTFYRLSLHRRNHYLLDHGAINFLCFKSIAIHHKANIAVGNTLKLLKG
jgi:predicted Fe-S protein YdhL (DUF1289 family)